LNKNQWVGTALQLIGLCYVISSVFGGLVLLSLASYAPYAREFGVILILTGLFLFLSFVTGIVSIIAGTIFAEKLRMMKVEELKEPERSIYEKLAAAYNKIYSAYGQSRLDNKIEAYIEKGFTREEAIQKIAKEEGYT